MNRYWKKFWKERYKGRSFNRAVKSMQKMEKYRYLPYPNHPPASNSMMPFSPLGFNAGGFGPGSMVINPVTGLPESFNPNYPYHYPFLHPYAFIPSSDYPYTIDMGV